MIKTLLKREIKANYKIFAIFIIIITIYSSIIVAMYDPLLGKSLNMMAKSIPELFRAFNMIDPGLTLLDFIMNYLYGFILIVIPLVFTLIMCYRLIGRYIEQKSFAYLLSSSYSRIEIIVSQYMTLFIFVFFLLAYTGVLVYLCGYFMFEEIIALDEFLALNTGLLFLHLFFLSICYLSVCIFNEIKYSIGIGGGLCFIFILIQMLSQASDKIEFLKYFTPLTLFNAKELVSGTSQAINNILILLIISIVLFLFSVKQFKNKDLFL
jgi:hypothetical protein